MRIVLVLLCMCVASCAFDGFYGQRGCGQKYSKCQEDRYYERPSYREREWDQDRPKRAMRDRRASRAVDYDVYSEVIYDQEDDGGNEYYVQDDNTSYNRALDQQKDSDQCLSYGFNPGTIEYSNCQQRLRLRRADMY